MRRKMAAGNWKMHGTKIHLDQLEQLAQIHANPSVDVVICTPATLISRAADQTAGGLIAIGAQDCHQASSGAHTGDIAATMLKDAGATHILAGHSERRADHLETDTTICAKANAAIAQGLVAIICVGETLQAREEGKTLDVIFAQLAGSVPDTATGATTVVAYEPVWAIGTGKVANPDQIGEVHQSIRRSLNTRFGADSGAAFRLLYGGSVKAANASEIFAIQDVDGALVGGASLQAADFSPIISALEAS